MLGQEHGSSGRGNLHTAKVYTDASWIMDNIDDKSSNGWIFTLGGVSIAWGSKK